MSLLGPDDPEASVPGRRLGNLISGSGSPTIPILPTASKAFSVTSAQRTAEQITFPELRRRRSRTCHVSPAKRSFLMLPAAHSVPRAGVLRSRVSGVGATRMLADAATPNRCNPTPAAPLREA